MNDHLKTTLWKYRLVFQDWFFPVSAFPFVYGVLSFWKNRQVIQSLQFLLVYKILRFYLLNFKYTAKLPSNLQFLLVYRYYVSTSLISRTPIQN